MRAAGAPACGRGRGGLSRPVGDLAGGETKTALFTMRLSYSGRAAHRASLSQGQEAFMESHVHAFERLGGVPLEQIRYDNLRPSVSRVLFGRSRVESDRWVAFRSHYGFDAFDRQPGHEGSHEKGGVEGEGGRFRRSHCVPMPAVDSIDELNALVEQWDDADDRRRIGNRAMSVGHDWAFERQLLRPLPAEPFDTALTLTPRVDRYAQVMVRCCQYSVPARFIGHRVRVKLSASAVTVYDRNTVVARHQRAAGKGAKVLDLDHDLEILLRKPGALPGAIALARARASGVFTPAHDAFWAAARKALGDSAGTRALVEVALLHRHLEHANVLAGVSVALAVGSVSADVVAVEARKAAQQREVQLPSAPAPHRQHVISLTRRRLTELVPDDRPLPSVAAMTTCSGRPAHEHDHCEERSIHPARRDRAGRGRGDRLRNAGAAAAHHPRPVHRDGRRSPARAAVLPWFPRRAG